MLGLNYFGVHRLNGFEAHVGMEHEATQVHQDVGNRGKPGEKSSDSGCDTTNLKKKSSRYRRWIIYDHLWYPKYI
jgi:hypothetical protein